MRVVLHGRGLAGAIVTEEGGDLSVVELQGQSIHGQLVSVAVDLHQVLDVNAGLNVSWLLFNTHSCLKKNQRNVNLKKTPKILL